jgi:hypothetical protein
MSVFDESKDKVVESREVLAGESTRVLVQIAAYNGGPNKLQLKRETRTKNGWAFAKLGRMSAEEFLAVVPAAMELMELHGMIGGA